MSKVNNLTAKIVQLLDYTVMLAGSEAMVASLPIYHSIKIAAKSNVPGAEIIFNNTKGLLPQFKRKTVN